MSKVLIGIGCDPVQELPAAVLAFSILKNAHMPVDIEYLYRVEAVGVEPRLLNMQRTAFSLQRFLLARVMLERNYDIAIYLDSDMLVLRPINELVSAFKSTGKDIATVESRSEWRRQRQSSVMIMDRLGAERLSASFTNFIEEKINYDALIYLHTVGEIGLVDSRWNGLEYLDQDMALLHYTDMDRQPWLRHGNPNSGIWYANLWHFTLEASGMAMLEREAAARHVRPALVEMMRMGPSISARSNAAIMADLFFVPPHRFKRIRNRMLRLIAAPLLNFVAALQSFANNGDINVR